MASKSGSKSPLEDLEACEIRTPPHKKRRVEEQSGEPTSSQDGSSRLAVKGRPIDGNGVPEGQNDAAGRTTDAPAGQVTWNKSVSGRLRTSFGFSLKTASQQATDVVEPPPLDDASDQSSDDERKQTQPSDANTEGDRILFENKTGSWVLPPPLLARSDEIQSVEEWQIRFDEWCDEFAALNESLASQKPKLRQRLTKKAFNVWVDKCKGLTQKQRKRAIVAAKQPKKKKKTDGLPKSGNLTGRNGSVEGRRKGRRTPSVSEDDEGEEEGREHSDPAVVVSIAENAPRTAFQHEGNPAHLQRYFPGLAGDAVFCVLCASASHRLAFCPYRVCAACGTSDHAAYECPARTQCPKCLSFNHGVDDCLDADPEQLIDTIERGRSVWCLFCKDVTHTDFDCQGLMRSYWPPPAAGAVRRVRNMRVYCYYCGKSGHFGDECPELPRRDSLDLRQTWSAANRALYVDPESAEVAIGWVEEEEEAASMADLRPRINGKSIVPRTHIVFEDDEDEDEDEGFIRPPVQRASKSGAGKPHPIRVQMSSSAGGAAQNGGSLNGSNGSSNNGQRNGGNGAGRSYQTQGAPSLPHGLPKRPPPTVTNSSQGRGKKAKTFGENSNHHPQHSWGTGRGGGGSYRGRGQSGRGRGGRGKRGR
ncbi:hypothetical protein VTK73DRAFT_6419 [Phialemonium thermophilum]|uniref:CCHC-type domain-containing protein n=1 Tax=Phialemonium thermophilum TaxID=223376 RepID=A0ABR3WJK1_9PEZI